MPLWLQVEVSGRWWRTKGLKAQGLELAVGRPWTSSEVLGDLWMAPRAGFEIDLKFLSAHTARASRELSTPTDTPRIGRAGFPSADTALQRPDNSTGIVVTTVGHLHDFSESVKGYGRPHQDYDRFFAGLLDEYGEAASRPGRAARFAGHDMRLAEHANRRSDRESTFVWPSNPNFVVARRGRETNSRDCEGRRGQAGEVAGGAELPADVSTVRSQEPGSRHAEFRRECVDSTQPVRADQPGRDHRRVVP